MSNREESYEIGYGKLPKHSRFKPRLEPSAERLFFAIAYADRKASNIDLTPEADTAMVLSISSYRPDLRGGSSSSPSYRPTCLTKQHLLPRHQRAAGRQLSGLLKFAGSDRY